VSTRQQFSHSKCSVEMGGQQTLDDEGILDCDGSLDSDDSNKLCWTYDESTSSILHATGCTICQDWKMHYEDDWSDEEPSLHQSHSARKYHIHCNIIRPRVDALSRERDEYGREVVTLRLELEATRAEIKEIQQETAKIQDTRKRERTLLAEDFRSVIVELGRELQEVRYIPPADASSPQLSKHRCIESIDVGNGTENMHVPQTTPQNHHHHTNW